jgi:outer membrane protein assembly factor BamC
LIETGGTKTSGGISWQPRPNDPELEKEFMRRLMVKLSPVAPGNTTAATDAALELPPVYSASEVLMADGKPTVKFKQGFDIAWRRVGQALDRNGFTVEDRDRNQGLYFVRYVEINSDGEQGFFSRLFSKSKPASGPQQYRLKISATDAQTSSIAILNTSGEPDGSETAARIAKLLANELK